MSGATLVIPAYNEAARLDGAALIALCAARADLRLVLVDDGSTDGTLAALQAIGAACPTQIAVLSLPANAGKAEAVRRGMLAALAGPAEIVGFINRLRDERGRYPVRGNAEMVMDKVRWGRATDVPLIFDGSLTRFEDDPDASPTPEEDPRCPS